MRKFLLPVFTLLSVCCINLRAQETIKLEFLNYDELITRSKKEKKPVMIYFTGTGCFLCVKMEKNVFPKPEIASFYNANFINVESFDDSKKPDSATKQLRRRFGIVSNPTFIFTDSTGEVIHKSGYKETEGFLLTAHQAVSKQDNYKSWKQQLRTSKPDAELMLKYLSAEQKPALYAETNFICNAQTELDRYFEAIPEKDYLLPGNWEIIRDYVANPYSQVFTYLLKHDAEFTKMYGEQKVNEVIFTVLKDAWSGGSDSEGYKKAEVFIRSATHSLARLRVLQLDYLYKNENNLKKLFANPTETEKFIAVYDTNISKYPYLFNKYDVNTTVNTILTNGSSKTDHYIKAKKWMQLILAIPANEDYELYATLALVCFTTKDYSAAVVAQEKAINIAIKEELEPKEIELYKKQLLQYQKSISSKL